MMTIVKLNTLSTNDKVYYKKEIITIVEFLLLQILIIVLLIKAASCSEISKVLGERVNYNITKLYPVKNITYHVKENDNVVSEQKLDQDNKILERNVNNKVDIKSSKHSSEYNSEESNEMKNNLESELGEKDVKSEPRNLKVNKTTWTIDAAYDSSKIKENDDHKNKTYKDSNSSFKNETKGKEFKPSPHLGSFYEEGTFIIPPHSTEESFFPFDKPSSGFTSFPKDFIQLQYKKPLDAYPPHIHSQYNFENNIPSKEHFETGLEARPTVETPVNIPAGGLYQRPDLFKEKPGTDGDDANFGLEFNDEKNVAIKQRRVNPWKSVLNFVTALIPVGIIISALTPSIITLENVDNNQ
ncbi:unnamed protein product, partial [Brenthis ino]